MDDGERLRRRAALYRRPLRSEAGVVPTARYLKEVQDDTASLAGAAEDPQNLDNVGPAYLRSRAAHYREIAKQQNDLKLAQLFLDLAESFEKHAIVKERSPASRY
jgi:hypothetical protein